MNLNNVVPAQVQRNGTEQTMEQNRIQKQTQAFKGIRYKEDMLFLISGDRIDNSLTGAGTINHPYGKKNQIPTSHHMKYIPNICKRLQLLNSLHSTAYISLNMGFFKYALPHLSAFVYTIPSV